MTRDDKNSDRFEYFNELFWGNDAVSEKKIIEALRESDESIRADALDYIISCNINASKVFKEVLLIAESEKSFQCICRITTLIMKWNVENIEITLPKMSTFDLEYLSIWLAFAKVISTRDMGALKFLEGFATHSDINLSELSNNLRWRLDS